MIGLLNNVIGVSHSDLLLNYAAHTLNYTSCERTVDDYYKVDGIEFQSYRDSHTYDEGHLSCSIMDANGNIHDETFFALALPIVLSAKDEFPELNLNRIVRMKVNALERKDFPEYSYNAPHHDIVPSEKNNYSFVYYLNDSDGDTFLFDQIAYDDKPIDTVTLLNRVSPKKNSLCIFQSNRIHASSNPRISPVRYVINCVIECK